MTQIKVDDSLTIEAQPDASLRRTEYTVVTYNREGNEVQGLVFFVTRDGIIRSRVGPVNLLDGVDIIG